MGGLLRVAPFQCMILAGEIIRRGCAEALEVPDVAGVPCPGSDQSVECLRGNRCRPGRGAITCPRRGNVGVAICKLPDQAIEFLRPCDSQRQ